MNKILVIYHANCADGFGAAWAMHLSLHSAEYLPMSYGDEPPDVKGRFVYIVDFSFKRPVLEQMRKDAKSLQVIDHHKTAQAELEGLDYCIFDMTKCGAVLTWEFIHMAALENEPVPKLLEYVQDRDLWQWKLPRSKEINAYIATVEKDFIIWSQLSLDIENNFEATSQKGKVALRVVEKYVKDNLSRADRVDFHGHNVPIINTTFAISELIGALAEGEPFAIGWFYANGTYRYSLRSREGGVDVSEIAKAHGGGGHAQAAGLELSHHLGDTDDSPTLGEQLADIERDLGLVPE